MGGTSAAYHSMREVSARLQEIDLLKSNLSRMRQDYTQLENEKNRLENYFEINKREELNREKRLHDYKDAIEKLSVQQTHLTKRASRANELEVELNKMKVELHEKANASSDDKSVVALRTALASMKNQVEAYIEEIDVISQSFDDIQVQNTKLLEQLSEQSNSQVKLREQLLKQQKDLVKMRNEMMDQERSFRDERELQKVKEKELQEIEKKYNLMELKLQSCERDVSEQMQDKEEMKLKYEREELKLQQKIDTLQSELAVKEASVHDKKRRLESDTSVHDKKEGSSGSAAADRQLKNLKEQCKYYEKLVLCPICNTNHKSQIITRCLHMFCNDCIKKSLESRNRKCPTCGAKYQASDLQPVFF